MLVALVNNQPGLKRAAAIGLLGLLALFGVGIFGAQLRSPERIGRAFFGQDFVALYISSKLILSGDGAAVFESARRDEASSSFQQAWGSTCAPWPAAYWPGFLLPVLPLTLFNPWLAYYLWTALSLAFFFFALWRLARASGVSPWPFWLIGLGVFPVVSGLAQGQLHGWQFIALTEFWLAFRRGEDKSSGLWLSLQIVKPYNLPLLLLYLGWQRRWRTLAWFIGATLAWLGLSVVLAGGAEGVAAYIGLHMSQFVAIDALMNVPAMSNWRALTLVWFSAWGPVFMTRITIALSLMTVMLVIWDWHRKPERWHDLAPQPFLMLIAASLLVGYYTHAYSLVLLLAPALCLLAELREMPNKDARTWSLLLDGTLLWPSLLVLVDLLLAATMGFGLLVLPSQVWILALVGIILLGVLAHPTAKGHESTPSEALQLASR